MSIIRVTLSKIRLQNISNAPSYIPSENEVVINRIDNNIYYGKSGVKTIIGQDAINAHLADLNNPHVVTLESARSKDNQLLGDIDFNSTDILNPVSIKLDTNNMPSVTPEGTLWWNNKEYTINIETGLGATIQIGQELVMLYYNDTGFIIPNGTVLHPKSGTIVNGTYLPTPDLADARFHELCQGTLSVTTHDIGIGEIGFTTRFGKVRGIDTSIFTAGAQLWVSTTPGELTETKPIFPNYAISMGGTLNSTAAPDGELFISITGAVEDTFNDGWDGSIRETFNFRTSSNGTTIIGTLDNVNPSRNLTLKFSDGLYTLDTTTTPLTINLTPAVSDDDPIFNFVYIPISTKVLTVSTSGWPTTEHCRIATLVVQTANGVQTNGALRNQNWNDHIKRENDNGHILHIAERVRQLNAEYDNGCEATLTGLPSNLYVDTTSGQAYQMHLQSFPAQSMSTGDDIHIINDPTTAYRTTSNLNTITTYSDGSSWNNQWTNIVIIGIINKTGEASHIMCNLSSNGYSSEEDALNDDNNYTDYTIPRLFKGVGILLARFTIRRSGTSYTYNPSTGYLDLRGYYPNNTVGGGAGSSGITTYLGLNDTPVSHLALAFQRTNAGATAIENVLANTINLSEFNNDLNLTDFNNDLNTSLIPENTNLYYTEARVSANTNVAANTLKVSFPGFTSLLNDYGFTDNSTNWNTAYGWGNHAGLYEPINANLLETTDIGITIQGYNANTTVQGVITLSSLGFTGDNDANNYTHPVTHPPSIITEDVNNRFVTDAQIAAWDAKINASSVTYGTLNTNGDVGTDAGQLAIGNHNHSGVYEPANVNIQSHISNTDNPHSVNKADVGLSVVPNTDFTSAVNANTAKISYTDATKVASIESGAEVNNISDVDATNLTDTGDTGLHYHSSDRNRSNHTGTQTASTISNFDTEVSNNSSVVANSAKITNATHTGEVTGSGVLTIASGVVDDGNLTTKFKGVSALTGTELNWDLELTRTKTLTTDITLTFTNLYTGVKFLKTTGDYSITFPSGFTYGGGERATTGTTRYQIVCDDASTPEGIYVILKDES